jgi:hypothetical protein
MYPTWQLGVWPSHGVDDDRCPRDVERLATSCAASHCRLSSSSRSGSSSDAISLSTFSRFFDSLSYDFGSALLDLCYGKHEVVVELALGKQRCVRCCAFLFFFFLFCECYYIFSRMTLASNLSRLNSGNAACMKGCASLLFIGRTCGSLVRSPRISCTALPYICLCVSMPCARGNALL